MPTWSLKWLFIAAIVVAIWVLEKHATKLAGY